MPWVPIHQIEGLTFDFASDEFEGNVAATIDDNVITAPYAAWYNAWSITFSDVALKLRLTFSDFSAEGVNPSIITYGGVEHPNGMAHASGVRAGWDPSPLVLEENLGPQLLYRNSTDSEGGGTFDIYTLTLEGWVEGDVPPVDPPTFVRPWWMCVPAPEPTTPPVRPIGFVSLADYDADFRFPLASSRVQAKTLQEELGCTDCGPNILEIDDGGPDPDPDPICSTSDFLFHVEEGLKIPFDGARSLPSWFEFGVTMTVALRFDSNPGHVYLLQYDGTDYTDSTGGSPPFTTLNETIEGEIADGADEDPENFVWSCIMATLTSIDEGGGGA